MTKAVEAEPESDKDDMLAKLLVQLVETAKTNALSPEVLETILARVGDHSAGAMKASLQKENETHPHISVFNPQGDIAHPRPEFRVPTYFCGYEEKAERLTRTEIELYNAIHKNCDAHGGRWTAQIRRNQSGSETLHINVPAKTSDERMDIPPLVIVLSVLNGGPDITEVHELVKQIERLKALAIHSGATAADLETAMLSA